MPAQDDGLLLGEVVAGLQGTSGYLRFLSALVLWHWHGLRAAQQQQQLPADNSMEAVALGLLHQLLCSPGPAQPHLPLCADPYSEAQCYYEHMRREAIALATACLALGHVLCTPNGMPVNDLNPDHALAVVASLPEEVASAATVAPAAQRVRASATSVQSYEVVIHLQVVAACALAAVRAGPLPAKLNQVIQPLMNALRTEAEPVMQVRSSACSGNLSNLSQVAMCLKRMGRGDVAVLRVAARALLPCIRVCCFCKDPTTWFWTCVPEVVQFAVRNAHCFSYCHFAPVLRRRFMAVPLQS